MIDKELSATVRLIKACNINKSLTPKVIKGIVVSIRNSELLRYKTDWDTLEKDITNALKKRCIYCAVDALDVIELMDKYREKVFEDGK